MYSVSEAYMTAMAQPVHRYKLTGYVGSTAFTEANILKGSLSINNKISNGQEVLVGSVNIGVLKATFIGIEVTKDKDITLSEGLMLAGGTYEYVPLGVYRVAEANVTKAGIVVTAYDRMSLFDTDFTMDTISGKPHDIAGYLCGECGVSLGMTSAEMEALPNGTETLTLYTENDVQTHRDVIFWLAQAMACFATVDRQGRLVFRSFKQTSDDTIDNYKRFTGASFSRFTARYSSITVTDLESGNTEYYGLAEDNYLTYDVGANPFLQYGNDSDKARIRGAVLNGIANIAYTPFKASVSTGALYDLGDVITNTAGLADGTGISCIMRYEWKYARSYMMECVGKNPALAKAKSSVDKKLQAAASAQVQDTVQFYLFTNAAAVSIADGSEEKIIDIRFVSNKATKVVFHAEVLLEADTTVSGITYDKLLCTVKYRYNDLYLDTYMPKEVYDDGNHILHLLYYFEIQSAMVSRLEVFLEADGGDVEIPAGGIQSSVYGQALVATNDWDGTIEIKQKFTPLGMFAPGGMSMISVIDSLEIEQQIPTSSEITEEIGLMTLGRPSGLTAMGIEDSVEVELEEVENG